MSLIKNMFLAVLVIAYATGNAAFCFTEKSFEEEIRSSAQKVPKEILAVSPLSGKYDVVVVPAEKLDGNAAMAIGESLIAIAAEATYFKACELSFFMLHEKAHLDKKHTTSINELAQKLFDDEKPLTSDQLNAAKLKLKMAMHKQEFEADRAAMLEMKKKYGKTKTTSCLKALFEKGLSADDATHPSMSARLNALIN